MATQTKTRNRRAGAARTFEGDESGLDRTSTPKTTRATGNPADSPDYKCSEYRGQEDRWARVQIVKEGIEALRTNKAEYLPKFEAETPKDWQARVDMTFANNYYKDTHGDLIGLAFSQEPVLAKDVPTEIKDLLEDIDGQGAHWHVFTQHAFGEGLDYGHGAFWTDMPADTPAELIPGVRRTLEDDKKLNVRPYVTFIPACDLLSWRLARMGSVEVLLQFVRRVHVTVNDGLYGTKTVCKYRVYRQEAIYDQFTGAIIRLGAMSWELWREKAGSSELEKAYEREDFGAIENGPQQLPLRIFYAGEKIATLVSKPHLYDLAWTSIEETQVASDYAAVMHRCNVPTPWFAGIRTDEEVNMSKGIRLPNAEAKVGYLEPAGVAIAATQTRLQDIKSEMRRQGAAMPGGDGTRDMTATEATQVARQKNSRLSRGVRSLQDAFEGVLMDIAAYLKKPDVIKQGGGSVTFNQNFASTVIEWRFVTACLLAYDKNIITRDEMRHVLRTGELPEDTDPEAVAIILDQAEQLRASQDAAAAADKLAASKQDATAATAASVATGGDVKKEAA